MEKSKPEEGKGRRKGRRKRSKDHHFMDAALDAFIRDEALHLWRDFEVYRARPGMDAATALAEAGFFDDKAPYASAWTAHWARLVLPAAGAAEGELFGLIEAAARAAVLEEREQRKANGDRPFEDLPQYNEFIRHTLNQLLAEDPK